jgi:RNA-splicing ligase RtcB
MEIKGEFNEAIIYTDKVEESALQQIKNLCDKKEFKGTKIRIMPDVHAGAGCVIGLTISGVNLPIIPNLIGVDLGCGISVYELNNIHSLEKLDKYIKENIPSGFNINEKIQFNIDNNIYKQIIEKICENTQQKKERVFKSIGSLGGGNHFIEINKGSDDKLYLCVHSGSRNFGLKIAEFYQKIAKKEYGEADGLEILVSDEAREAYIEAQEIAVKYAEFNRETIIKRILNECLLEDFEKSKFFTSIHNYLKSGVVSTIRKGATLATVNTKLIIPLNMAEGSLICEGKSNKEWNYSAPHGAGRVLSRKKAQNLDMEEYKEKMKGIYTSCVSEATIDESPMAYKKSNEIINNIQDTVKIIDIIKPIYNFKAQEEKKWYEKKKLNKQVVNIMEDKN